jgi:hypothetical protein
MAEEFGQLFELEPNPIVWRRKNGSPSMQFAADYLNAAELLTKAERCVRTLKSGNTNPSPPRLPFPLKPERFFACWDKIPQKELRLAAGTQAFSAVSHNDLPPDI